MVGVVAGRVEDGDADEAAGVDVRMPHIGEKLHRRRRQRIVLGKLELCGKDAALKGSSFGPLDEAFPVQQVVLGDGAGGDAFGRVVCEGAVFLEEAAVGGGLGHGGRMTPRENGEKWKREERERREGGKSVEIGRAHV